MARKSDIFVNILILIFVFIILLPVTTGRRKITYFSTEHPNVTYRNSKYITYAKLTAQRYGRHDPFYYVGLHLTTLMPLDNNIIVHFYFYELLTNVYKRGFIEMHIAFCDLVLKNDFFGLALRKNIKTCPLPPGENHWYNMTIPIEQVPRGFPFTKGRIYCNLTINRSGTIVASGYINLELKQFTYP